MTTSSKDFHPSLISRVSLTVLLVALLPKMSITCTDAQQTRTGKPETSEHAGLPKRALRFEVASIRESQSVSYKNLPVLMDGSRTISGTLFSANAFLSSYNQFANNDYDAQALTQLQSSLPASLRAKMYTIEARAAVEPSRQELQQMVLSLLEDRLKLKVRFTETQGRLDLLTLAKGGTLGRGLTVHPANLPCTGTSQTAGTASKGQPCVTSTTIEHSLVHGHMTGQTMEQLATHLSSMMPAPRNSRR